MSERSQGDVSAGWEHVHLLPGPLPDASLDEITTTTSFLGHDLAAPLVISSMTGGHEAAFEINRRLARAAEHLGIGIGVGSQRAALEDARLAKTYRVVREEAPTALVIANLGICQFVPQGEAPMYQSEHIGRAVAMVEADALAIHFNLVEELIQTEGDRNMSGLHEALAAAVSSCSVPVIAKETGAGVPREAAQRLVECGVAAIDVGGAGGTSFARIEGLRAQQRGDRRGVRLGSTFGDWGIPTAVSILEVNGAGVPIIATGGIRSGLDAAKAFALGADLVGLGQPVLKAAMKGVDPLLRELESVLEEIRIGTLLAGATRPQDLRRKGHVVTGLVSEWMRQRGAP